jgi:hypothetical protein
MGNKKGRMPIPFDGDKEKKYIRLVAQPMPYGGLSFQSLPFQGESRLFPIPSSLFPCEFRVAVLANHQNRTAKS